MPCCEGELRMKRMPRRSARSVLMRLMCMLAVFLCALAMSTPAYAAESLECTPLAGRNVGYHNYKTWASPRCSYLTTANSGYMRVQGNVPSGKVTVAYYDSSFALKSRQTIESELPIFGAFYETDANYYLVTGQKNLNEDNSVEVFRITKFDKSWNRLGSCGLYGANTYIPFDAGSCRLDHDGSWLVVRTSHEMYASSDGVHHQANVTILVDTSSMTVKDSYTSVMNTSYGYVSHSFNQFVKLVDGKVVSVDHGDAYPRGIVLMEYPTSVSTGKFGWSTGKVATTTVMSFAGEVGDNYTGASVGGFEVSDSSFLVAGNSIPRDDSSTSYKTRNVFVATVDRATKAVSVNWLTSYAEGDESASTPQLTDLGNGTYLVMWTQGDKVCRVVVDGRGAKVGDTYESEGSLSDCAPLVSDGTATWYTWEDADEDFYQLSTSSPENVKTTEKCYNHDYQLTNAANAIVYLTCTKCGDVITGRAPISFDLYWRNNRYGGTSYYSGVPSGVEVGDTLQYMDTNFSYSVEEGTAYRELTMEVDKPEDCTFTSTGDTITFNEAGTYHITIYATYNPDAKREVTVKVVKPLEGARLDVTETSPQQYGAPVTLTATADGGKGTLTYTFVAVSADGQETTIGTSKNTTGEATCTWIPSAVGTYRLRVDVKDSKTYDNNAVSSADSSFEVVPATLMIADDQQVEAARELTFGQALSEAGFRGVSFVAANHPETMVSGTFAYDEPDAVLDAGTHEVSWTFTPGSGSYAPFKGTLEVVVGQATPQVQELPVATKVAYTPTLTLADVALSGGAADVAGAWEWANPDERLSVPGGTYDCRFVPESANYRAVDATLRVSVSKAAPYMASITVTGITYGQTLAAANVEATFTHKFGDTTPIAGTISWVDDTIVPTVADSAVTGFELVFVPDDTTNYMTAYTRYPVFVDKAPLPMVLPPREISVSASTATLSNEILKSDLWAFEDEMLGAALEQGVAQTFTAHYLGEDEDCYETTTFDVQVVRSVCDHDGERKAIGAKEPTCEEAGASGDVTCLKCHEIIEANHVLPALGHDWSEGEITRVPTCSLEGAKTFTCNRCGAVRVDPIDKDPTNHAHIETYERVPATLISDGCSSRQECTDCGKVVVEAEAIPQVTEVSLAQESMVYDGHPQEPEVLVMAGSKQLAKDVDYKVSYEDNVDAGFAYATVTGIEDYEFETSLEFTIEPKEITPSITYETNVLPYNGCDQGPMFTVTDGERELEGGIDYYLEYHEPESIEPGTYGLTVVLYGNYQGSASMDYHIVRAPQSIDAWDVTVLVGRQATVEAAAWEDVTFSFTSSNPRVATVDDEGNVVGKAAGKAYITIETSETEHYEAGTEVITVTVKKAPNTLSVKAKKAKVALKLAKVKKAAQKVANVKVAKKGQGTVVYTNASKNKVAKKFKVNKKNGTITVPKGTKKGTYAVKLAVKAAGNAKYNKITRYVTFKVVVK